ncbi:hypothetical protein BCR43DRAFT_565864 [Syncephalastrum racemosum]|uniref:Zinc finger PHD-type domain-containing protein n=1 Tax=Syncephalastrum racemosum TaxID=13706 RepID=A0A1X2H4D3_SYNRA|nr:hypothetical protein BCR43DRAFT_565864 [Syncephalastrum racemosum]
MPSFSLAEVDHLRNNIDFASIAQFFHTFQSAFRPWPVSYNPATFLSRTNRNLNRNRKQTDDDYVFATEDLERMLLDRNERYRLEELMVRMLRLLTRNRFINKDTWQMYFAREIEKRQIMDTNPLYSTDHLEEEPEEVKLSNEQPKDEAMEETTDKPKDEPKAESKDETEAPKDEAKDEPLEERKKEQIEEQKEEPPKNEASVKEETEKEQANGEQANDTQVKGEAKEDIGQITAPKPSPAVERKQLVDYFSLSIDTQVSLLHLLCELQLDDAERFREHLDNEEDAIHWRVDPIGYDSKGSTFWLFDDNRLYKEMVPPKPKSKKKAASKPSSRRAGSRRTTRRSAAQKAETQEEEGEEEEYVPWKLICLNASDWEQLPRKFEQSPHASEQHFYDLLVNDVLPKVLPVIQEHEENLRKQEALASRKRSSRLMFKEIEALERDQASLQAETSRRSSRREEQERKREQQQKEEAARAREERIRDRERRLLEREHQQAERERKKAIQESMLESQKATAETTAARKKQQKEEQGPPKRKRGRKPKKKQEEDAWNFDCVCGISGQNIDDGSPLIACERCGTWQHIDCLKHDGQIDESRANLKNFVFMCRPCSEKESQHEVDIDGMDDTEPPRAFKKIRFKAYTRKPNGQDSVPGQPAMPVHSLPPINSSSMYTPYLAPIVPGPMNSGHGSHQALPPMGLPHSSSSGPQLPPLLPHLAPQRMPPPPHGMPPPPPHLHQPLPYQQQHIFPTRPGQVPSPVHPQSPPSSSPAAPFSHAPSGAPPPHSNGAYPAQHHYPQTYQHSPPAPAPPPPPQHYSQHYQQHPPR